MKTIERINQLISAIILKLYILVVKCMVMQHTYTYMPQCNEMVPDDDLITFLKLIIQARLMFDGEQASLEAILQTGAVRAPKPIKVFQLLHKINNGIDVN